MCTLNQNDRPVGHFGFSCIHNKLSVNEYEENWFMLFCGYKHVDDIGIFVLASDTFGCLASPFFLFFKLFRVRQSFDVWLKCFDSLWFHSSVVFVAVVYSFVYFLFAFFCSFIRYIYNVCVSKDHFLIKAMINFRFSFHTLASFHSFFVGV